MDGATQSLVMSADAKSSSTTEQKQLNAAIETVRDNAKAWARLGAKDKAALLRECIPRVLEVAPEWVAAGAEARGASEGEEWLVGVTPTIRQLRLVAESLEAIALRGRPPLGRATRTRPDGRLEVDVFPTSPIDKISFTGFSAHCLLDEGVDRAEAERRQAAFYQQKDPEGGVSLILGAGNVSSIPPMDVISKMFVEGFTCILKMNPVNEWVGPFLERALQPLISRNYLQIVYGAADVGKYLVYHEGIADIHITGSNRTHDLIVWGPPGRKRERRMADNDPLLKIPISSELGNVSPVAIIPFEYSEEELSFMARNVVSMVTNNASFNCNAAKMLLTSTTWAQRARFLKLIEKGLAKAPPRKAYYPGAFDRYETLTGGREGVKKFGSAEEGQLPWALIPGVDSSKADDLFQVEPFCGILSEARLPATNTVEFIERATTFMNDKMWGTLNAMWMVHPMAEKVPAVARALDQAIIDLRYGTVAINHWPALGYAFGSPPWGGHQSATLSNIQSGLGWVHNSYMLEGIDKCVVRGSLVVKPTPVWFQGNPKLDSIAPKVAQLEAEPSWLKVPGLLAKALF